MSNGFFDQHGRWIPQGPRQVSPDEFMIAKVAEYRRSGFARELLEYLGMTREEYAEWFTTGVVAPRVLRVWRLA
jgi:hypothetical protein